MRASFKWATLRYPQGTVPFLTYGDGGGPEEGGRDLGTEAEALICLQCLCPWFPQRKSCIVDSFYQTCSRCHDFSTCTPIALIEPPGVTEAQLFLGRLWFFGRCQNKRAAAGGTVVVSGRFNGPALQLIAEADTFFSGQFTGSNFLWVYNWMNWKAEGPPGTSKNILHLLQSRQVSYLLAATFFHCRTWRRSLLVKQFSLQKMKESQSLTFKFLILWTSWEQHACYPS